MRFILLLSLLLTTARAVDNAVIFTGTTTTHETDTFAYLVLQADAATLHGRAFALYRKSGQADSADTFARQGVLMQAVDSRLIASLMNRAQKIGGDMARLDEQLGALLGEIAPAAGAGIADKLAVLLAKAETDVAAQRQIRMLARQHPIVAMAAGTAFADKITSMGIKTYELRLYDVAADKDLAVVGRVTVNPQNLLVLPAPGVPVEVPDASVKGNLNVSLRWSTPNALRDLSPLHHGYDLYRVPRANAAANNWITTPPATLAVLLNEPAVKKANALPLMPPTMLDATQAADTSDIWTIFVNDDNGRYQQGGSAFADGSQWVYFVCARDLLGRAGLLSPGGEVTVHDRYPPLPPQNLRVTNRYRFNAATEERKLNFEIEWDAPKSIDGGGVSAYYLYRWRTPSEIPAKAVQLHETEQKPHMNLIAVLPGTQRSFVDDGSTSPPAWADPAVSTAPMPAPDSGKVYYYTVRAADDSTGANLSGNSAPAWGVLRDRAGPAAGSGEVLVINFLPNLDWDGFTYLPRPKLATFPGHLQLAVTTDVPAGLDWAEFRLESLPNQFVHLGRTSFVKEGANLVAKLDRDVVEYRGVQRLWCRVGTRGGHVGDWVKHNNVFNSLPPLPGTRLQARWHVYSLIATPSSIGSRHVMVDPGTGLLTDISGSVLPTTGSKEYKIYRRVDLGPQTLIAQGAITSMNAVTWTDANPPGAGAKVCYYAQLFDEHGNPSPLFQLGTCVDSGDGSFLKAPVLEKPVSIGTPAEPRMRLRWFCARPGVEKFEIWVAMKSGGTFDPFAAPASPPPNAPPPPETASNGSTGTTLPVSSDKVAHPNRLAHIAGAESMDFAVFETGLARYIGVDGDPQFEIELPVSAEEALGVMVRAVGPGAFNSRFASEHSNVVEFAWSDTPPPANNPVPWPARPLPTREAFHPGITALYLNHGALTPWRGIGIRIGEYLDPESAEKDTVGAAPGAQPGDPKVSYITGQKRAESHLYTQDLLAPAEPDSLYPGMVLPLVLYRAQLPSTKFPDAPGDLVQVTPLMEEIAQDILTNTSNNQPATRIVDPFVQCLHNNQSGLAPTAAGYDHALFLLDRHPVIKGAKYRYYLVRFTPDREIERVIVTNDVTIPES
jgi:hypothetical protein